MRILVYPHDLGIGGSQLNAIQIAARIHRAGHPTVVYGRPGPLVETVKSYGLEFLESPAPRHRPSKAVVTDLRRVVAERGIDILHGYEWPPALECFLAAGVGGARPFGTVLSMAVAPFLPRTLPLGVGTEQIAAHERLNGRKNVFVLEPPVDLASDGMSQVSSDAGFRQAWGLNDGAPLVVCVTRLAHELKLEGLLEAIAVTDELSARRPLHLVLVGDGPARAEVEKAAAVVNERRGPNTVVLTGALSDPRPAYAAADVALGMGSSALRAMAFGKPLVVQGEGGFWRTLSPDTVDTFLWTGWYGYGGAGKVDLSRQLDELLDSAELRGALGAMSRSLVEDRFSVEGLAERQLNAYQAALAAPELPATERITDAARSFARFGNYHARRRYSRWVTGRQSKDDFNARPVARSSVRNGLTKHAPRPPRGQPALLWFGGSSWDGISGTDKQLVQALLVHRPVVWADPPTPTRKPTLRLQRRTLITPDLLLVQTIAPPGLTRPGVRRLSAWLTERHAISAAAAWGRGLEAVVVSSPLQRFPAVAREVAAIYFETDDFVEGADLFGVSKRYVQQVRQANLARCDVVLAVTQPLADQLGVEAGVPSHVLPNGCRADQYVDLEAITPAADIELPPPIMGVVGQFNERLDLDVLETIAETGRSLLLVGPNSLRDAQARARFDSLVARKNVQWVGAQLFEDLPAYLRAMSLGITPYLNTAFNRASFPLKTLEYLSAGIPAVSTRLPAAEGLNTDLITLADDAPSFAKAAIDALDARHGDRAPYRAFAATHSWEARAQQFLEVVSAIEPERGTCRNPAE